MAILEPGTKVIHKSQDLGQGEVIRMRTVSGQDTYQVDFPKEGTAPWLPGDQLDVVRGIAERFLEGEFEDRLRPFELRTLAEGLCTANASTGELLVSYVDPLPHQILVTHRVVTGEPIRRLIADDVGLGKTIETGMILSALRSRGVASRVLIVTPAGLVPQWIEEMDEKFGLGLMPFSSANAPRSRAQWEQWRWVIASVDTLKDQRHLDTLQDAGQWDVVVFDEAHRLSKARDHVAQRYRLAEQVLDERFCRTGILLTATPHQGDNEKFVNLLRLLRPDLLEEWTDLQDDPKLINQIMLRNRKLEVIDHEGRHVFDPSPSTRTEVVQANDIMELFHAQLSAYLKRGYNQVGEQRTTRAIGFVMTTYAKLAASSPRAILKALERRLVRLRGEAVEEAVQDPEDERYEGEQDEARLAREDAHASFFDGELEALAELQQLGEQYLAADPKLTRFLELLDALLTENPDERVLVFTEYRGTQEYLAEAIRSAYPNHQLTLIHGGMGLEAKRSVVKAFNTTANFLVSTEAGGEGINLQERCHVMFNYDLPWNPMRLRQRVGRLYRYGQQHQVHVINMRTAGTVDDSILEHLRTKIDQISHDLAALEGDNEQNLHDDVLGQTVARVPVDELVRDVHRGKSVDRAKLEMNELFEQIKDATRLQRELFAGVDGFRRDDYERVHSRFEVAHVERFVAGVAREVQGTFRDVAGQDGVFELVLPGKFQERHAAVRHRYPAVTCDRSRSRRGDVEQLLFTHPAFDALIETATSTGFEGRVVRRHARVDACPERNVELFQFSFFVAFQRDGARQSGGQEFVPVLVREGGEILTEEWAWDAIYAESTAKTVRWDPSRDACALALEAARTHVDARTPPHGLQVQPAVLAGAALLVVN